MTNEARRTVVLIVTHGDYGRPLLETAEAIVGPLDVVVTNVCFAAAGHQVERNVLRNLGLVGQGAGVLILTDLCGSTPANACQRVLEAQPGSAVVSGLNLAMLIKLSTCDRAQGAQQLAQQLYESSRRSITRGLGSDER